MTREKLERPRGRIEFDVNPAHLQAERFYQKSVTLDVKSELAGTIRLGFKLSHDSDVRNILLDYNLDIIPISFRLNPHTRLEMPLESCDEAAVAKWLDERIVEFANAYLELLSTKQYQEKAMVSDTVAGISFPKHFAASTLGHEGTTCYFISDETCRESAKKHGLEVP